MRGIWLLSAVMVASGCSAPDFGNPNQIYPGTPRPFPTAGVAVSNACGLLSPTDVYDAFGSSALPPRTGTDAQPPNCTWVTTSASTHAAELVLEVSTNAADVARVRTELAPPLPAGAEQVTGLGRGAVVEAGGRVVALVDDRTALLLRLSRDPAGPDDDVRATAVRLARVAVRTLGSRRPAVGQLLATPRPAA